MRTIILTRHTASKVRRIAEDGAILLFTADYGCNDCEEFEEMLPEELSMVIDYKVIVTHEDESVTEALNMGVETIPQIWVGKKKIDHTNIQELLEAFKNEVEPIIQLAKELKTLFNDHAEELKRKYGWNVKVDEKVAIQIAKRMLKYGKAYCPCRVELKYENICPCIHHIDELRKYGKCRCGLFTIQVDIKANI